MGGKSKISKQIAEIIYKENFDSEYLSDGDVVEVATFCGGG